MSRFFSHSVLLGLLCTLVTGLVIHEVTFAHPKTKAAVDGPIEEAMEGLVAGMKSLAKSIGDAEKNEESFAALRNMQQHTIAAKGQVVPNLESVPEKDRDAHQLAYRADMARLLSELSQIEILICEGKNEAAKGKIRSALIPLRNASHEKYQDEH